MKKIILFLVFLFACIFSLRFISWQLNQDDFITINFTATSANTLQNYDNNLLQVTNLNSYLIWFFVIVLITFFITYSFYSYKKEALNTLKINIYSFELLTQTETQKNLNNKENLINELSQNLIIRFKTLDEKLHDLEQFNHNERFKNTLNSIKNIIEQVLRALK